MGQGHFEGLGDTKCNKMVPNLMHLGVGSEMVQNSTKTHHLERLGGLGLPTSRRKLTHFKQTFVRDATSIQAISLLPLS